MGPFVPDLISDSLNLVVALAIGFLFGFVLEQAGFSSSRRLAGVFYGYDLTVLRVFFTAAVTAATGVLLLGAAGLLDLNVIFVNPTWMKPAIVGGVIMGLGFLLGGFCPGTSVCAVAIGKYLSTTTAIGGWRTQGEPAFALAAAFALGLATGLGADRLVGLAVLVIVVTLAWRSRLDDRPYWTAEQESAAQLRIAHELLDIGGRPEESRHDDEGGDKREEQRDGEKLAHAGGAGVAGKA